MAFAANLFTLYLFYEMLSLATYPLVTHHQDKKSRASGRKYLTFILGTSIGLVLPAMLIIYSMTGTLEFSSQGILAGTTSTTTVAILLLMCHLRFRQGGHHAVPWVASGSHGGAHAGERSPPRRCRGEGGGLLDIPHVVTGVFGVDLLQTLGLGTVLCYIAAFTIIVASLIALSQNELKRRLAFSTVAQLSYIVLGAALLSPKGLVGGMVHIAMHAFGKITLFFCAGAIFVATGKKYISDMAGIGKRMPVTMIAFFIGSLSVIGLPPTGGFFSKWYLILGTLEADKQYLLVVLLVSSFLNAVYFLPIVYNAFFCAPEDNLFENKVKEAPLWCVVPLVITALVSIALFFYPTLFQRLAELAI